MSYLDRLLRNAMSRFEKFRTSEDYWVNRYKRGGNSGRGSYGGFAEFKSKVLNDFVEAHDVRSVIEYGCGDGNQLRYLNFPEYLGFDVSDDAVNLCRKIFAEDSTKSFRNVREYSGQTADLTLSLDVIFHLVEDAVFFDYMARLFGSATRYVIIYSTDFDEYQPRTPHVRHRKFTMWIDENIEDFRLIEKVANALPKSTASRSADTDFFIYSRV